MIDAKRLDDGLDRHAELPDVISTGTLTHSNDTRRGRWVTVQWNDVRSLSESIALRGTRV
jgi:hypothetical protein